MRETCGGRLTRLDLPGIRVLAEVHARMETDRLGIAGLSYEPMVRKLTWVYLQALLYGKPPEQEET